MITFDFTLKGGSPTDREFVGVALDQAGRQWSAVLGGDASIEVAVTLGPLPGAIVAQTTPGYFSYDGPAVIHLEPGPTYEARTGQDGNGADPDALISVDVSKLARSPNAILDMTHEIGHAFAFDTSGYGPTLFDEQVTGGAFVGEFAMAVYGGPVPLTVDGHHVAIPGDLMFPYDGQIGGITATDLGMMADSGVPIGAGWLPVIA